MRITGPAETRYTGDGTTTTTYEVTTDGAPPKGTSAWVRQDVYDLADTEEDLAQYSRVRSDGIAVMSLGPTPSWPDIPGGGGRIELTLYAATSNNRWRKLDTATVTLLP